MDKINYVFDNLDKVLRLAPKFAQLRKEVIWNMRRWAVDSPSRKLATGGAAFLLGLAVLLTYLLRFLLCVWVIWLVIYGLFTHFTAILVWTAIVMLAVAIFRRK